MAIMPGHPLINNNSMYAPYAIVPEQQRLLQVSVTQDGNTTTHVVKAISRESGVVLCSVITQLKCFGVNFDNSMISYLTSESYKINCWCDPIPDSYVVPDSEIISPMESEGLLRLYISRLDSGAESDESTQDEIKCKRSKERTIAEVMEKVDAWKKRCNQLKEEQPDGKQVAERASEFVGIPKKSLDDYLHQIKLGVRYNFKFEKHGKSKIGRLRRFNKNHEEKERKEPL